MSGTRVLVAGASIAGPALAHWLRRRGAEVTVVERAPELRPGGQAVDARGVAKEVIRRMGLDAAVRAARTETAGAYTRGRGRERAGDLQRGRRRRRRVHRGDRDPARGPVPGAVRRHPRRCRVRLRRPDRRAHPGRGRGRRGLRGRRPAALRPGDRGRRAALGAAGDGLRAARAVRPPPRARAGLLQRAQRVRAGPLADRVPGDRALRRPAAHPRGHRGDGDVLLPRGRPRRRPPRRRGPEAPAARADGRATAGGPRASSSTWTTPRTSTSTRSPRW